MPSHQGLPQASDPACCYHLWSGAPQQDTHTQAKYFPAVVPLNTRVTHPGKSLIWHVSKLHCQWSPGFTGSRTLLCSTHFCASFLCLEATEGLQDLYWTTSKTSNIEYDPDGHGCFHWFVRSAAFVSFNVSFLGNSEVIGSSLESCRYNA